MAGSTNLWTPPMQPAVPMVHHQQSNHHQAQASGSGQTSMQQDAGDESGDEQPSSSKKRGREVAQARHLKRQKSDATDATEAAGKRFVACRNHTGFIGVRKRNWGMFAAEIRDGAKRRWLGSFTQAHEAGMAYDAALILQKKHRAKTNFIYPDFDTIPRAGAEVAGNVRYDLVPKEIIELYRPGQLTSMQEGTSRPNQVKTRKPRAVTPQEDQDTDTDSSSDDSGAGAQKHIGKRTGRAARHENRSPVCLQAAMNSSSRQASTELMIGPEATTAYQQSPRKDSGKANRSRRRHVSEYDTNVAFLHGMNGPHLTHHMVPAGMDPIMWQPAAVGIVPQFGLPNAMISHAPGMLSHRSMRHHEHEADASGNDMEGHHPGSRSFGMLNGQYAMPNGYQLLGMSTAAGLLAMGHAAPMSMPVATHTHHATVHMQFAAMQGAYPYQEHLIPGYEPHRLSTQDESGTIAGGRHSELIHKHTGHHHVRSHAHKSKERFIAEQQVMGMAPGLQPHMLGVQDTWPVAVGDVGHGGRPASRDARQLNSVASIPMPLKYSNVPMSGGALPHMLPEVVPREATESSSQPAFGPAQQQQQQQQQLLGLGLPRRDTGSPRLMRKQPAAELLAKGSQQQPLPIAPAMYTAPHHVHHLTHLQLPSDSSDQHTHVSLTHSPLEGCTPSSARRTNLRHMNAPSNNNVMSHIANTETVSLAQTPPAQQERLQEHLFDYADPAGTPAAVLPTAPNPLNSQPNDMGLLHPLGQPQQAAAALLHAATAPLASYASNANDLALPDAGMMMHHPITSTSPAQPVPATQLHMQQQQQQLAEGFAMPNYNTQQFGLSAGAQQVQPTNHPAMQQMLHQSHSLQPQAVGASSPASGLATRPSAGLAPLP